MKNSRTAKSSGSLRTVAGVVLVFLLLCGGMWYARNHGPASKPAAEVVDSGFKDSNGIGAGSVEETARGAGTGSATGTADSVGTGTVSESADGAGTGSDAGMADGAGTGSDAGMADGAGTGSGADTAGSVGTGDVGTNGMAPAGSGSSPAGARGEMASATSSGVMPADGGRANMSAAATHPQEEYGLGVVLATALNVRAGPSADQAPVGLLYCGDFIALEGREGSWYRVRIDALEGWSHVAYVVPPVRPGGRRPTCGPDRPGIVRAAIQSSTLPKRPERNEVPPRHTEPVPDQRDVIAKQENHTSPSSTDSGALQAPTVVQLPATKPLSDRPQKAASPVVVALSQNGKAKPVQFPHQQHNETFDCVSCHHPLNGSSTQVDNPDKKCRSCHAQAGQKGRSPVTNKDAFHGTCRVCHDAQGAGPTKCTECHGAAKQSG